MCRDPAAAAETLALALRAMMDKVALAMPDAATARTVMIRTLARLVADQAVVAGREAMERGTWAVGIFMAFHQFDDDVRAALGVAVKDAEARMAALIRDEAA